MAQLIDIALISTQIASLFARSGRNKYRPDLIGKFGLVASLFAQREFSFCGNVAGVGVRVEVGIEVGV